MYRYSAYLERQDAPIERSEPAKPSFGFTDVTTAAGLAYEHGYIALPATGDHLMTVFTATVVLQRLALRMSERKAAWLDARDIADHGVHPDVPKNVSKSITVD